MPEVWKAALKRGYTLKKVVGTGSYGIVVKGCLNDRAVAIKCIEVERDYQYTLVKVQREARIMQFLSNDDSIKSGAN